MPRDPKPEGRTPMTTYVVLRLLETDAAWSRVSPDVPARNDLDAIKRATADLDAEGRTGTFLAVPARSWNPRSREVTTVEKELWT